MPSERWTNEPPEQLAALLRIWSPHLVRRMLEGRDDASLAADLGEEAGLPPEFAGLVVGLCRDEYHRIVGSLLDRSNGHRVPPTPLRPADKPPWWRTSARRVILAAVAVAALLCAIGRCAG